jgi:hypothetical protein
MIAGNSLVIQNNVNSELATFLVDASGLKAKNMNLELSNAKNVIDINPEVGIVIKKTGGAEVLSIGSDGNIRISHTSIYDLPPYPVIPPPETWDTLAGKPLYVIDEDAPTKGLHISSDRLGYYEAPVGWKTYMDNAGNFYLGAENNANYLSWTSATSTLKIKGSGIFTGDISQSTGYAWDSVASKPRYVQAGNTETGLHIDYEKLGYVYKNPTTGIASWKTYMDNAGNFYLGSATDTSYLKWENGVLTIKGSGVFSGSLSAATGTFTGDITSTTGTISATRLLGAVDWSQITNAPVPVDRINTGTGYSLGGFTAGSLSGYRVSGGRFVFPGGSIGEAGSGLGIGLWFSGEGNVTSATTLSLGSVGTTFLTANYLRINTGTGTLITGGLWKDGTDASNQIWSIAQNDTRYAPTSHSHGSTYASYYHYHSSVTANRSFRSYAGGQINMSVVDGIITALS